MESSSARISVSSHSGQPTKRLLFDRRYGWVIDEWKEPSDQALEGGRGRFCILPLARALLQMTTQSINRSAILARKALENPQLFSHEMQAAFDDGLRNFTSSGHNFLILSKNSQSQASNGSSHSQMENNDQRAA
ncbi:hypothetical protein L6164_003245 [Bauhinia variegata]|uniref:Uncharacterized protein n=1 Tax=Bauhinia variegata TaxID=167791 RepID=A0ACB9Q2R4_BAUVA|nr:hypothetical protein L6164_003245 [Bauhinia variegata]